MKLAVAILLMLGLSGYSFGQSRLSNVDVIEMVKSGLSSEVIVAKIRSADAKFDVSTDGLKKLAQEKVPDSVVVSMIEKDGKDRQERKIENKELSDATNSIPEQGTLSDIKGKTKVFILATDLKARDRIAEELNKKKLFEIVDSVENSDFMLKFESWIETVGVVANVNGNTATAQPSQVRIGVLTVVMPSAKSNRLRLVYSQKKTQRFLWSDHPAESTTKEFIKDFSKIK